MKKFGFNKKDKAADGDEDSARSALFGSRKGKASPAPDSSKNPYAAPAGASPDPYAKSNMQGGYGAPPSYGSGGQDASMDRFRQEKSPVPQGGYGGAPQPRAGYGGSGAYGGQAGYGDDRYGQDQQQPASRYGPGGYGGLGRSNSGETMNTDAGRNELFGNAPQRHQKQQEQGYGGSGAGSGTAYGEGGETGGYGAYQDRQLTAEEEEEEDVQATKQQIKFIKQQDVSSTRNALRIAQQAEETGRDTLARLGAQGERIHNTEKNLDLAANQNRIAEEKARELKTLNRSMFAVHVSNPFTATKRREEREQKIMDTHRRERDERDATRAQAYGSQARQEEFARDMRGPAVRQGPGNKGSMADRAKYQFEADSEDDEMENEIDNNLDLLHGAAGRLKGLAGAMGKEVDQQNKHIERIIGKTDKVDDQIAMNRARLDRIK